MLLLIMCCDLEVTARRMTPAITLVFAHAFVSGSTALVHQLMGNRVLHRCPLAQRGPATLCLHLGSQRLLELFVLADAQASALPACGCGTLGAQGTRVTRRSRTLDMLAWDHGDGLATRTGHLHPRKVHSEIILGKTRPNLGPGAGDNVHTLRHPLGHPGAGHVPQVDIELQQAWSFLQRIGQQLHHCMLGLVRRADHSLPDDFALQIHRKVLLEAIESFGAAFAAVTHVLILEREASVRRDVLLEAPPARPALRVWCGILRDNLGDGLYDLLERRCLRRQGVLLLQPVLPPCHLLQDQAQRVGTRMGLPPIQVQCGFETALSHQRQPGGLHDRQRGDAQCVGCKAYGLAQGSGVESRTARSCLAPKPPVCSAKATVRSSRVLSKWWAISRIRKLHRVP
jgi:hypothetical protein